MLPLLFLCDYGNQSECSNGNDVTIIACLSVLGYLIYRCTSSFLISPYTRITHQWDKDFHQSNLIQTDIDMSQKAVLFFFLAFFVLLTVIVWHSIIVMVTRHHVTRSKVKLPRFIRETEIDSLFHHTNDQCLEIISSLAGELRGSWMGQKRHSKCPRSHER